MAGEQGDMRQIDPSQARLCPHCGATGTCRAGHGDTSCATCQQAWSRPRIFAMLTAPEVPNGENLVGKCMVCFGGGIVEGATFKIRNYFPFAFALVVVLLCFAVFFLDSKDDALVSSLVTVVGTIVGFYFGGGRSK